MDKESHIVTTSDIEAPIKESGAAVQVEKKVPPVVFKLLGCVHCEWDCTVKCPMFNVKEQKQYKHPESGICPARRAWLQSLTAEYPKMPSLDQWRRDFILAQQMPRFLKYADSEATLMAIYEKLDPKSDKDGFEMERLAKQMQTFRSAYLDLSKFGAELSDKQVARDQPKKLEVTTHKGLNPEQFYNEIMRNMKTVDAKVLDEKESEDE